MYHKKQFPKQGNYNELPSCLLIINFDDENNFPVEYQIPTLLLIMNFRGGFA